MHTAVLIHVLFLLGSLSLTRPLTCVSSHASPDLNVVYPHNHICGVWILQSISWILVQGWLFVVIQYGWSCSRCDSLGNCVFQVILAGHIDKALCFQLFEISSKTGSCKLSIACAHLIQNALVLRHRGKFTWIYINFNQVQYIHKFLFYIQEFLIIAPANSTPHCARSLTYLLMEIFLKGTGRLESIFSGFDVSTHFKRSSVLLQQDAVIQYSLLLNKVLLQWKCSSHGKKVKKMQTSCWFFTRAPLSACIAEDILTNRVVSYILLFLILVYYLLKLKISINKSFLALSCIALADIFYCCRLYNQWFPNQSSHPEKTPLIQASVRHLQTSGGSVFTFILE